MLGASSSSFASSLPICALSRLVSINCKFFALPEAVCPVDYAPELFDVGLHCLELVLQASILREGFQMIGSKSVSHRSSVSQAGWQVVFWTWHPPFGIRLSGT